MIRPYRGVLPKIAASAYIDASAQVIGDVTVGERASIWPNVTARGDVNTIRIGDSAAFDQISEPTPAQRRAFELLAVPIPLTLT